MNRIWLNTRGNRIVIFGETTIKEIFHKFHNIICFGGGRAFNSFMDMFEETPLASRIMYIVENDSSKWGTVKYAGNRKIPIVSYTYFSEQEIPESTVFIITLKAKDEILTQYRSMEKCRNIQTVWYLDILREYYTWTYDDVSLPMTLKRSEEMLIPKVIHYCWFGKGEMPYENRVWMESWEKYCPDYKIVRWDESNYDVTKNAYMYEAYQASKWGFVSDYARLDILYDNGGVYLDTDVELVKNLDELLYQPAFMGWEDSLVVNSGLGIGAVKGVGLIKEMKEDYEGIRFLQGDGSYDLTACPIRQTRVLKGHGLKRDGKYQIVGGIAVLPVTYLCGKPLMALHDTRTEYTFSIHQFQGSWL